MTGKAAFSFLEAHLKNRALMSYLHFDGSELVQEC